MSDGERTVGRENLVAATAANDADVPVSTIAFGTSTGTIEIEGEPFPVPVPVAEAPLEEIADTTGGSFFTAATAGELRDVYEDIGSAIGFDAVQVEIARWFVGAGLGLLLLSAAGSLVI